MPDYSLIDRIRVLRVAGPQLSGECLGVGFIRKNSYRDACNLRFPNFVLVLVLQGTGKYLDSRSIAYDLQPGSSFVRLPNIPHSNYVDPQSGYLECYIELGPQLFHALSGLEQLQLTPPVHTMPADQIRRIAQMVWQLGQKLSYAPEDEFALCIADTVTLLYEIKQQNTLTSSGSKYQDLVDLACQQLSRNFTTGFSLQKFCRRHSVGYENFRKIFRERIGISPGSYRIQCRLESAAVLLRSEQLTIKEIAEQLGYNNAYEFSSQFKKKFGTSPGQYRNLL